MKRQRIGYKEDYQLFLQSKGAERQEYGFEVSLSDLNTKLFDFQKDIVRWSLKRKVAAVWADCGLGKTPIQLEWAYQVYKQTGQDVLILAPLAVSKQTKREGDKFSISVNICRSNSDIKRGINITNYEMLHKFDPTRFGGIVLDESGILKSFLGKFRNQIIENFQTTPYKLCCTATPSPNDYIELGNHSEFLGILTRAEMLSMFFINDSGDTGKWRLKGYAEDAFWRWLSSWAIYMRKPSDLGYEDKDFELPKLKVHEVILKSNYKLGPGFFSRPAVTLEERRQARTKSLPDRVVYIKKLVMDKPEESWLIWCDLNIESETIKKAISGIVEVKGADSVEHKERSMLDFASGKIKMLVTKPKIAGFGMNWQQCHNVIFAGLSDSYESYYQAVRRCWRFGQKELVNVHIILSDKEKLVLDNVRRKEVLANKLAEGMLQHMKDLNKKDLQEISSKNTEYKEIKEIGKNWIMYQGDCVPVVKKISDNSIHFFMFSPPFASLFTYSDSNRDMGNCEGQKEFLQHFKYLVFELYRVLKPGRLLVFHCMNLPATLTSDGYMGMKDFRGELIRLFQEVGFIYHSEVCIWKDPLVQAVRTKALSLAHKQIVKDSTKCGMGYPDYIVAMRKLGINEEPVSHKDGFTDYVGENTAPKDLYNSNPKLNKFSHKIWQRYASPVWMDIRQTNTLNLKGARDHKDERHICPLQLDVIDRCLELWTNEGDTVVDPFAGIGSTGYIALQKKRKFVGIELKPSYFKQSLQNLKRINKQRTFNLGRLRIKKEEEDE